MEKIKAIWDKISYEAIIFGVVQFWFLTGRSLDLDGWSSVFNALDYSMGFGSRLLIGSIYRLFYGEYLDESAAYKYVGIGIMLTITVLAIVLGRLIRMALASAPSCRNTVYGVILTYLAAPFSIAYVWNEQNMGRFDVYMFLIAILGVLASLVVKNFYIKIVLLTILGVIGLAIHQGFAFLYYPWIVAVLCYDVFAENRVHVPQLAAVIVSGMIEVGTAVFFQFFSWVNFSSTEEMFEFVSSRTNMEMSDWTLQIEYFEDMRYQLEVITLGFFQYDRPFLQTFIILLFLAPLLVLYLLIWRDVFAHQRTLGVKWTQSPYLYVLLVNVCYVPMFVIHTDWGRHFAPLMAMPTFVFLFFLAKRDASMRYAFEKMEERVRKYPLYFVLTIFWVGSLDSFGARNFQPQVSTLIQVLQYGFHIN